MYNAYYMYPDHPNVYWEMALCILIAICLPPAIGQYQMRFVRNIAMNRCIMINISQFLHGYFLAYILL